MKVYTCKECNNQKDLKIDNNLIAECLWGCPECGYPHDEGDFMVYEYEY